MLFHKKGNTMVTPELLKSLCGRHPARTISFKKLYKELESLREQRLVVRQTDGDLAIYNYSRDCMYSGSWNLYTCIARGLVLNTKQKKVVATSFPKFFNYGEGDCFWTPNYESVTAYEKMDGCLGIVFHDGEKWRIASRGSFTGEVQKAGEELFEAANCQHHLTPGVTYIFEILTSVQRIVVPYDSEELVLLAAYTEDGFELPYSDIENLGRECGFRIPEVKKFSTIKDAVSYTKSLDWRQEGYVIRFDNGHRVKVKSDPYLEKHKLLFNFGPLSVWESFVNGGTKEYRSQLPEEFWPEFDEMWNFFEFEYDKLYQQLCWAHEVTKHLSNQELGSNMVEHVPDENVRKFIWPFRNGELQKQLNDFDSRNRLKFCDTFRPTGNVMPKGATDVESSDCGNYG